jgi:hypothetical protein
MKITLTTAQAVSLAKAIAPAISADPVRVHLCAVQVITTGEYATFTATDGYRMHRITVPQVDIDPCEPLQLGGVELVGALLGTAKAIGKGSGVIVLDTERGFYLIDKTPIGSKVVATGAGVTMNIPVMDIDYAPCDSILGALPETESGAYYHAPYLADLVTAAGHISGKAKKGSHDTGLVKIENIHPRKPMHVTADSVVTGMQFHGVLMPQRAS